MKRYDFKTKNEIHNKFVKEGISVRELSRQYNGNPSAQCIIYWSRQRVEGKPTWEEERDEYQANEYEKLSPQNQVQKILMRINKILSQDVSTFTTKDADALAKLQKMMERIVDKKFQIPMMFELLTKEIEFLMRHYSELVTTDFLNAIRHFKNELKEKLEN